VIKSLKIKNFKSIEELDLELGRFNVFIGENGAGKSNILEAIVLAGAASADKLDNEFLSSRGIRVTQPEFMRSAFLSKNANEPIIITAQDVRDTTVQYSINNDNAPYSNWTCGVHLRTRGGKDKIKNLSRLLKSYVDSLTLDELTSFREEFEKQFDINTLKLASAADKAASTSPLVPLSFTFEKMSPEMLAEHGFAPANFDDLENFLIFSPENSALRAFERDGQIEPLGINGEGLLKLLTVMSQSDDLSEIKAVKKSLKMFGWFQDFLIKNEDGREKMILQDCFVDQDGKMFDQRSANEGFLFAAFYFALFSSRLTPTFFAIDNIDASLNPKLCERLIRLLVQSSKKNNKQAILTTHNPATLDGLNLDDDEQRLFVVSRGRSGQTRIRRFAKPQRGSSDYPIRLSEAFIRGSLGGLPKGF